MAVFINKVHDNVTCLLRRTKKLHSPLRQMSVMLTSGVVFHEDALPHTSARNQALLEHFI